jgi:ribosomal protein S18 acetylase RimI-like enzyme
MAPMAGKDAAGNASFLERPKNSVWLAEDHGKIAGFMRFEGYEFDGVASLEGDDGVIITGAYTRPAYRRQGAAVALLDAALRDYQSCRINYCAVTFESFNPEASSFWPRYFEPVCFSLLRVPEFI